MQAIEDKENVQMFPAQLPQMKCRCAAWTGQAGVGWDGVGCGGMEAVTS